MERSYNERVSSHPRVCVPPAMTLIGEKKFQLVVDSQARRRPGLIWSYTDLNLSLQNCSAVSWIVPSVVRPTMWSNVLVNGDIDYIFR